MKIILLTGALAGVSMSLFAATPPSLPQTSAPPPFPVVAKSTPSPAAPTVTAESPTATKVSASEQAPPVPPLNQREVINDPPVGEPISLEVLKQLQSLMDENATLRTQLDKKAGPIIAPPAAAAAPVAPAESKDPQRKALMAELRQQYKGTNVDVYAQGDYVVVRIPEATYRMGQVKMPISVKSRLKPVADAASKYASSFDLIVEGHSDATPVKRSSAKSNWTVAFSRAESVADELEQLKVPLRSMAITSRGSGLLADQKNPFAEANRRVELVFGPKRSIDPLPAAATEPRTRIPDSRSVIAKDSSIPATSGPQYVPAMPVATRPSVIPSQPTSEVVGVIKNAKQDAETSTGEDVMIDLPVMVVNAPVRETSSRSINPVVP